MFLSFFDSKKTWCAHDSWNYGIHSSAISLKAMRWLLGPCVCDLCPTNSRRKDQMDCEGRGRGTEGRNEFYSPDCRTSRLVAQSPTDTKVSTVNCLPQMIQIGSCEWLFGRISTIWKEKKNGFELRGYFFLALWSVVSGVLMAATTKLWLLRIWELSACRVRCSVIVCVVHFDCDWDIRG